jgi:nitrogen-specific signal transduction histidine kinase
MTFEQQWLEYDYNPFIVFNSSGKVISLNSEANFLLGSASTEELYKLATTYASINFGFKTTFLDISFGRYKFFGLTVGYEKEEEIGIKLYQMPSFKIENIKPSGELVNIYTLVDLCISTNSINSNILFIKDFDPTIPEIIISADDFIKALNQIYKCFQENDKITTKIFYRIGEHIKIEQKKYSLFSIQISAKNQNKQQVEKLKTTLYKNNIYIDIADKITINIPMVTANGSVQ